MRLSDEMYQKTEEIRENMRDGRKDLQQSMSSTQEELQARGFRICRLQGCLQT